VLGQVWPAEHVAAEALEHGLLHQRHDEPLAVAGPLGVLQAALVPRGLPIVTLKARFQHLFKVVSLKLQCGSKLACDESLAVARAVPGNHCAED